LIYAIRAVGTDFIKFGKANDPVQRLAGLQTSNPFELKLVACAEWPDKEESYIHMYLDDFRHRGEWFVCDKATDKIVGLLRDGEAGLREWQRISRSGNQRPFVLRNALKAWKVA
jgi:hypothetical protein